MMREVSVIYRFLYQLNHLVQILSHYFCPLIEHIYSTIQGIAKGDGLRMVLESVSLKPGEKRNLRVLVENTKGLDCFVSSAKYILRSGNEIESSGECTIQSIDTSASIISMLVSPQRVRATYDLDVEYLIDDETYVYTCQVRVCGR